MNALWLLVVPVAVYFVGGYAFAHRIRASRFASRPDIPFAEIYKSSLASTGASENESRALWIEAAKALRIPPEKLRADDRFDRELSYSLSGFPFVDLNDDFYAVLVAHLRQRNIASGDAEKWKTLGEYIVALTLS